ncbi:uncharacterized protein LOC144127497 [Amblyomma americanum]
MQFYNKEDPNDARAQGLTGSLVAYFVIMIAIMFIFTFAIFVYAQKKKNCKDAGLTSTTVVKDPIRRQDREREARESMTSNPGDVNPKVRHTTESRTLETFPNLLHW